MIRDKAEYATKITIDQNPIVLGGNGKTAEDYFNRYRVKNIQVDIKSGIVYDLHFVGEGATSVCYKAINDRGTKIIKEFFPITYNHYPISYFTRDEGPMVELKLPVTETTPTAHLVEKYKRFLSAAEACNAVAEQYRRRNATVGVTFSLCDTSLNLCYVCEFQGGETLENYWKNKEVASFASFDDFCSELSDCANIMYRAVLDVKMSHEAGYINGDIKPDNLWVLNMDDAPGQRFVRNLDFGSFIKISDMEDALKSALADGAYDVNAPEELAERYFESSINYYPPLDVQVAIIGALNEEDENKRVAHLLNTDWFALFRCMLKRMLGEVSCEKRYATYMDARKKLREMFKNFEFNMYAYEILYRFEKIIHTVFMAQNTEDIETQLLALINVLKKDRATKEGLLSAEMKALYPENDGNENVSFKAIFESDRSNLPVAPPFMLIQKMIYRS